MLEEIYAALESYGYNEFDGSDEMIINLIIDNAEQHIKGFCNISQIPKDLKHTFIHSVCGEFLYQKYNSGNLPDSFDFEVACSSILERDVKLDFNINGTSTAEQRFLKMVNELRSPDYNCLIRHRKLVW